MRKSTHNIFTRSLSGLLAFLTIVGILASLSMLPVFAADDDEADGLDRLFEAAGEYAFVAGQITAPDADDFDYESYYNNVLNRAGWLYDMGVSMIMLTGF